MAAQAARRHCPPPTRRCRAAQQSIGGTIANFECFGQQDNFTGRRDNPPDAEAHSPGASPAGPTVGVCSKT